jgi:hypothetical protein
VIEVVGQKRKMDSRGPGRESFKSSRACVASSQQLSNPIIEIIETQYQNCCVINNLRFENNSQIFFVFVPMKKYEIKPEELGKKDDSHDDRIVISLTSYLKNLQEYGAKFVSTENTIEKLLTG